MGRNYFRRCLKVRRFRHLYNSGTFFRHLFQAPQNANDYILFPDSRVMDSMDYYWNYLSIPLKTFHDYNQEDSQDSWGYLKEEDFRTRWWAVLLEAFEAFEAYWGYEAYRGAFLSYYKVTISMTNDQSPSVERVIRILWKDSRGRGELCTILTPITQSIRI